jgi:signal transduction histidine kinase
MGMPIRVLIVEDSEDDALLMLLELRRNGYEPTSERVDSTEAMSAALDRQTWDLILSDYAMPHFSMSAALTMVQEKGLDLPFILVSGAIGEEAAVTAMRAGAHDYVMKGNIARLAPVVERELREAEMRRERKRVEEELKTAQEYLTQSERLRALGEMASGVAHDFNNILAIILGRAKLALEDVEDEKLRKSIHVIEQTAIDAATTVRRLQGFAGVNGDRAFEEVDLNYLVEGALEMVESRREELEQTHGIAIEIGTELNEVTPIAGDAAELREALLNIIFNAMDAMPTGGKITIKSKQENSSVALSISDTGIGIPKGIKKKLFDPFFTTKASKGSGLGLSVTYGIVNRHGGRIDVESTLGKGTTFHIRLPVAKVVEAGSHHECKTPYVKPSTVLLIDDLPEVIEVLGLMLQQLGHQVTGVTSGKEALSAFKTGDYGLVITDLGMPNMSGRDVARAVKEIKPETPVVLITGWGLQLNREEMPEIDGVIEKPFSKDALITQMAELAGHFPKSSAGRG